MDSSRRTSFARGVASVLVSLEERQPRSTVRRLALHHRVPRALRDELDGYLRTPAIGEGVEVADGELAHALAELVAQRVSVAAVVAALSAARRASSAGPRVRGGSR